MSLYKEGINQLHLKNKLLFQCFISGAAATKLAETCADGSNINGFVTTGQSAYFHFNTDHSTECSGFNILYFSADAGMYKSCLITL